MKRSRFVKLAGAVALALLATADARAQAALRIRGSDTLGARLVPQWAESFKRAGGDVSFHIAAEGSSTAFTHLASGSAEIGMSSRKAKEEETNLCKTKGVLLKEFEVAWDMMVVIVNKNNPVTNLTQKQVAGIFTGAIKDWGEVGGTPGPISIYTRNTSSGTYKDWMTLAMKGKDYATSSLKMASNDQIASEVGSNPGGVGYVGHAYIKGKGIKAISTDGIAPNAANLKSYPYSRPTFLYTNGGPTGKVKEFIDFCLSPAGVKITEMVGFFPAK